MAPLEACWALQAFGGGGGGGVLRNNCGKVLCEFSEFVGCKDVVSAELLTIAKACSPALSKLELMGIRIVIVSDCKQAVDWINGIGVGDWKYWQLIMDIRSSLGRLGQTTVEFNSRNTNSYADILAKKGAGRNDDSVDLDAPPLDTIICFPGSEVPELFSFQSMESVITVELPTDWFNDNFVGFALCAIVEFQDHKIDVQELKIFCKCKLKSGDEYEDVCSGTLDAFADLRHGTRYIGSDDLVYMGFDNRMYPCDIGDNSEASFQFYIGPHYNGKRREDCKLKKCGVRLMYSQDHGEFIGSFSSVKEEDVTHPHPKRLKVMEFH
ncbi:hypothetical protein LWI28_024284 [Acer negundo]|uniref:RNase H type-1 domain-containing protein n=1 Tax=Acer negundo TaxID=4023 RepID=A0AAD5J837_ACENE|nr:hypothetical protein LWI28_024284 [Acer negundo]